MYIWDIFGGVRARDTLPSSLASSEVLESHCNLLFNVNALHILKALNQPTIYSMNSVLPLYKVSNKVTIIQCKLACMIVVYKTTFQIFKKYSTCIWADLGLTGRRGNKQ